MTYRGHIQNGVVVLDERADLPDGTPVAVQSLGGSQEPAPGSPQAVLKAAGTWHGDAAELDRLLEELRREKWAEVEAENNQP
jgi:hypothetical protein